MARLMVWGNWLMCWHQVPIAVTVWCVVCGVTVVFECLLVSVIHAISPMLSHPCYLTHAISPMLSRPCYLNIHEIPNIHACLE